MFKQIFTRLEDWLQWLKEEHPTEIVDVGLVDERRLISLKDLRERLHVDIQPQDHKDK
jgi:hypothetical protein